MVLGRRTPLSIWKKTKSFLWPQGGWQRSFRYFFKRVLRLSASPHAIAVGFATGVLASFTPFIGLHLAIAAVLCIALGGNILASAFGTIIGNPLTFPLIWAITFKFGNLILGNTGVKEPKALEPTLSYAGISAVWPTIKPMLVGAIPLGLSAAIVSYILLRLTVSAYQNKRRQVLMARLSHLAHLKDRKRQEAQKDETL